MKRRIAALLMVVGFMLATVAPVLAQPEDHSGEGIAGWKSLVRSFPGYG